MGLWNHLLACLTLQARAESRVALRAQAPGAALATARSCCAMAIALMGPPVRRRRLPTTAVLAARRGAPPRSLQPERTDPDRMHAAAVTPTPFDGKDAEAEAAASKAVAALAKKQEQSAGLGAEAGGIKAGSSLAALVGVDGCAAIIEGGLRRAQADWRVKRFLEGADASLMVRARVGVCLLALACAARRQAAASGCRCGPTSLHPPTLPACVFEQEAWLAAAFGGPLSAARSSDLAELYNGLAAGKGFNPSHLDVLAQHTLAAMEELGMDAGMRGAAAAALANQRRLWCPPATAPA